MKTDGITITGVTCDSRKVKDGYAFVAIKGDKLDGNNYIDFAIENGAAIVYTEEDICNKSIPVVKVDNPRIKLAELLNEFYDFPSEKIKLIGVTGTNGKTTTSSVIESIFKEAGYKTGLIGTLGIKIGNRKISSKLTTPDTETLFFLVNKMVEEGIEVAVMEVSSHGLKFNRAYGLDFDVAIHTNIAKDHLDFHQDYQDYINSKKILFDSLSRNKMAILNVDDENATKLVKDNNNALVITYGLSNKSTVTASSLEIKTRSNFILCIQRGITTLYGEEIEPLEFPLSINLIGKHNVYNALAAITTAVYFGISLKNIKASLENFDGVNRRLEKVYDGKFCVIDDFSHNPSSFEAVFETLQSMTYNNIVIVNSIRGNRGMAINEDNAKVITAWYNILGIKKVILSLSNDVVIENDMVTNEEVNIYRRVFNDSKIIYEIEETLKNSIVKALEVVEDEDIILLLGAQGMEKGKEILTNILKLSEKDIG